MPVGAREAALMALADCRRNGRRTEEAIDAVLRRERLDGREARLAARIFYGTVQNICLCDHCISACSSLRLPEIQPQVLDILRISVYQMLFLSGVPARAAVSEAVELAKRRANARAAAFVNAVLRKVSQEMPRIAEVSAGSEEERLSVLYSHPEWLVREFVSRLGLKGAEELLKANNGLSPVTVMVNTTRADLKAAAEALAADGAEVREHPWLEGCLEVSGARIDGTKAFLEGLVYVQDPASSLAVAAAGVSPGMFVVDGCAAPGGKSFASAIAMGGAGRVLSCDISAKRLRRVAEGARRLGLECIKTRVLDARKEDPALIGRADVVLADVPCSGFGVIRKKPEIRFKSREEISGLPEIQLDILCNLSKYVRPGGILLYSTCTVLQTENEDVVRAFLGGNPGFAAEPFSLPGPAGRAGGGMVTLWPHVHGTDGFFICRLRRLR